MRKIIDRKIFDTTTAEPICKLTCTKYADDFGWHDTSLYRTKSGVWFLAGEGNGLSMWQRPAVGGGSIPGEGIRVVKDDEALQILEAEDVDWIIEEYFEVEEA
jgi:hypothetical protein